MSIDGVVSQSPLEADFLIFPDSILPVMFPEAAWMLVKIESFDRGNEFRINSHTANQPASEAGWWTLRNLGNGKLVALMLDNVEIIFSKVGELPPHLTPKVTKPTTEQINRTLTPEQTAGDTRDMSPLPSP